MDDKEAIEMMRRCSGEIKDLRRQIERLSPKADAYDNLATVLRLLPHPSGGMSEDLAWRLDETIKSIEVSLKPSESAEE